MKCFNVYEERGGQIVFAQKKTSHKGINYANHKQPLHVSTEADLYDKEKESVLH